MPRAPVLDWSSFFGRGETAPAGIDALPNRLLTTSGRAAIYHALLELRLPPGCQVLVPTYHCPTMVAPIVQAGLRPLFFALEANGLPDLAAIERRGVATTGAMIVAHYFGIPRSLAAVRDFCDRHRIALIEDCAHCFFGDAGARPVGQWGDFAVASLTKFFPVPEAGLLASGSRAISARPLASAGVIAQLKGAADVLERAAQFRRLRGTGTLLRGLFALKRLRRGNASAPTLSPPAAADPLGGCDMSRVSQAPLWIATRLVGRLPRRQIIAQRMANFEAYRGLLTGVPNARPAVTLAEGTAAPYVFPLWVDDADRVYRGLRARGMPVLRWDQLWHGTPRLEGDAGSLWSRHVLQLLCHQALDAADISRIAAAVRALLESEIGVAA
jgi:dTDP-4-amino-4,6-dideoxygalactose transaminase